ncbi:BaiN/RdsA family NAD(P)/FAD-dependent oxidoreductase [Anaerocolumna xylanovorans]|uniref:Flavoprotein, HI0933 family n=1 Tax=Anaerocolumna xylanovorans DSM 12503 TaxID=1121345 RepID=A0A1M7YC22_9FIRM|nr:NAD(P)/FAD-dependent oxidoreductase [Anaerocolumna xylanovorans]SHO50187.1 hypothetical protein SAMN02745217_02626 [Anaerocolumna xylanovorans DSM 12503]
MGGIYIIGGGASGLFAAIWAAKRNKQVTVLEHKDRPGKKILATGNGKCNYTNLVQTKECYRSNNPSFAGEILKAFDTDKTVEFFKEIGIYPHEKNGYLYPNSGQASSVLEVLLMEAERLNVKIECDTHVQQVDKKLRILTDRKEYQADRILLASGGMANPALGSDGSGFAIAKALGHKIITPLPALVQLKSREKYFKTLSGVRTEAEVSLYSGKKLLVKEKGEILFADYGVSGIPVMQVSRYAAKALSEGREAVLILDFFPSLSKEEIKEILRSRLKRNQKESIEQAFIGLLNKKLAYTALKESGILVSLTLSQLKEEQLNQLALRLKEWKIPVSEPNSFEQAQVTAGGVDTLFINPATMESKLVKGLFFAGEVVDVDGTCGGYNLQWAWSSGFVAGSHL